MSRIGYSRLSAIDQNTDRQEIALAELNIDKYFTEKISVKNTDRPQLKKMLEYIREGDTAASNECDIQGFVYCYR